jgi:NTP pyrophosphatase (non-canonical NTP hydrolase)
MEELGELVGAVVRGNRAGAIDGFGDVMVTLIIASDLMDIDLLEALESAYNEIKDRKGTMTPAGVFIKEGA